MDRTQCYSMPRDDGDRPAASRVAGPEESPRAGRGHLPPAGELLRVAAGFAVLLAFWAAGELLVRRAALPVPGSVLGMVLLTGALRLRCVPVAAVEAAAALMIRRMALFFVPPGVAILLYLEVLRAEWLALMLATLVGTVGVLLTVGLLQKRLDGHD